MSEGAELPELWQTVSRSTYTTARTALESERQASFDVLDVPPADRGAAAWRFLAAAFVIEMLIWAFPNSYGVLLSAYHQDAAFASEESPLALIGQFTAGLTYMLSPFVFAGLQILPAWRRRSIVLGAAICPLSLIASAFVEDAGTLVAVQGVLYAVGAALIYYPCQYFLQDWFIAKRGLASGICFAATGAGGVVMPLVYSALLDRYSIKTTLIANGMGYAVALVAVVPFLRPRTPHQTGRGFGFGPETRKSLKQKMLWLFVVANIFQSLGYFLPSLWLPTFASALGLSTAQRSSTVTALNATAVVSRLLLGVLSDSHPPHLLAGASCLAASLCAFLGWGVGGSRFSSLLVFALLYGAFAGGFTSLWSSVIRELGKADPQSDATLWGVFSATRGIGVFLSAPIASALQRTPYTAPSSLGLGVGGGLFAGIILFAGSSLAVGGLLETVQAVRASQRKRSA